MSSDRGRSAIITLQDAILPPDRRDMPTLRNSQGYYAERFLALQTVMHFESAAVTGSAMQTVLF